MYRNSDSPSVNSVGLFLWGEIEVKCSICKGKLRKGRVNHIVDGSFLFKNVVADVCDRCGEYYLDTKAAREIESIVKEAEANEVEVLIMNLK